MQAIAIQEGGKFRWPAASGSFFDKAQTAGGVLLDIGVHVLDLLLWWLGKPVSFTYQDDALDGLEANAFLDASYANGVTTTVRLSRDSETLNTYAFQFERAVVHLRVNQANRAEITMADMPMTLSGQLTEPICQRFPMSTVPLDTNPQAFVAQLINVISAIECGQTPLVPGIEGIRAIEWIEECYRTRVPINVAWMPHSDGIEQCVLR